MTQIFVALSHQQVIPDYIMSTQMGNKIFMILNIFILAILTLAVLDFNVLQ